TDVTASALGFDSHAVLWLRVNPAHLQAAGEALARSSQVAYAAAVTGAYNLSAAVYSRDLDALYRFVTTEVGSLPGVQGLEISPVLSYLKQAGTLVANDRFVD
ncbi:MAG: Lrp/AsnC ligand binding domain-containing protein, partial [Actinobacteria bacterium]|nr:Lrp/AsnC ligand binding domain-containing protein [Actinomycetota bacterium]